MCGEMCQLHNMIFLMVALYVSLQHPNKKGFIKALFPCSTEPSTIQGTYANEQTAKEPLMKMERCVHKHQPQVLSTFF